MIINNNISALNSQRNYGMASSKVSDSMSKISSGSRINRAADDASGLAVSEKMRSQIRGLNQGAKNIQNGISFIQTAEGYLNETTEVLQRVRELAVQSANGIYSGEDRALIQIEVEQLVDEINRVASHAQFNGMNMLTGRFADTAGQINNTLGEDMVFHVGPNMDQQITSNIGTMTSAALGLMNAATNTMSISISSADAANRTIGVVDKALGSVVDQRASLGAVQNRLSLAYDGTTVAAENMQAAESRIRDLDIAKESINFSKSQILEQASNAMLAQANTRAQGVLQLLR